jgi:signal transduction histidine kinase
VNRAPRSTIASLRRELATRDAFLARVSAGLDARLERLGSCTCAGLDELRGFARELAIIAGRDEARAPRRVPLDAGLCIAERVERWRAHIATLPIAAPGIRVEQVGDLTGAFDPDHLETMLAELLSNACKYGNGRPVVVRVVGHGAFVRFVVEDEGVGLDRGARIGRRFVRGPRTTKTPGFGVGVWLTRVIAEAHGGSLRLTRRPGGGTRAVIKLPRDAGGELSG